MTTSSFRDFVERTFWTALSVFLAVIVASPVLPAWIEGLGAGPVDLEPIKTLVAAALAAAVAAVVNAVTIFARNAFPFLPDPGTGLPPTPTTP